MMTSSINNIVEIIINKQIYKIACDEGQEDHIKNLSLLINDEVEKLVSSLGQVGDARLLLMTCLIIADKLKEEPNKIVSENYDSLAEEIKTITKRIELVADKLV
jgi:cell division protein ZapA